MRRLLLCTALLFGTLVVTTPANAHTEPCAGVGNMTTTTALQARQPAPQPITTSQFSMAFTAGWCGTKSFTAQGTLTGWCSDLWGYGITNTGHRFAVTVTSTQATFTGEVDGVGIITPDPTCLPSAQRYLVSLSGAKLHGVPVTSPQPWEIHCDDTSFEC